MAPVIDFLTKYWPLLVAVGLGHAGAGLARAAWAKVKAAAEGTPTKVDDFLVHVVDGPLSAAMDLLDSDDPMALQKAKDKLGALKAMIPSK